jgi:2-dehydropantoate 2-reductase
MRILVLGAGATGGYFGGRLAEAGADVTFLVRPRRAAQLARDGLVVESRHGPIRRPAKTVQRDNLGADYDLILFTCKAYDLEDAVTSVRPAMNGEARLLPILNGLKHFDLIDSAFGADRVLGGTCQIAATLSPAGEVLHLNEFHVLTFGSRDRDCRPLRDAAERLGSIARSARFEARLSDDILQDLWKKFVMLTSTAALTCLFRSSFGDILAARDGRAIMLETLEECAAVAGACGQRPSAAYMAGVRDWVATPGSTFSSSMFRDIERRGPIEADHIVGDMLARAEAARLPAPWLRAAYAHLQAYMARRQREGW